MPSPIDDLFLEIFGFLPNKDGASYEMLASAVMKLLFEKQDVFHDQQVRGAISKTMYQIDVLMKTGAINIAGEAKDYSITRNKVGRPDLQKLAGAIPELPIADALFFSATDFTKPAKKYAQASEEMFGKQIHLFHLRPSTALDEEGRIKTIILSFHIFTPVYEKADFRPSVTASAQAMLTEKVKSGELKEGASNIAIDTIYDKNGKVLTTIHDLTSRPFASGFLTVAEGSFWLPGGHIKFGKYLVEIHGLTFKIPYEETIQQIEISSNGEAKLLIKSEDHGIDKLISEGDLKKIKFLPDGKIEKN